MENKVDVGSGLLTAQQLETILNKTLQSNRADIEAWMKRVKEEHEDNFIPVKGYVAVLNLGINVMSRWDGCNGYYEMRASDYVEWRKSIDANFNPKESDYVTKQGLEKIYRFPLYINDMADPEEYSIKIIEESKLKGLQLKPMGSSLEMLVRR